MRRRIISSTLSVLMMLAMGSSVAHADDALVDCSDASFKSGSSATSLMGWSNRYFKKVKQARAQGRVPASNDCAKLIRYRGDAHCQQPTNKTTRKSLAAAQALCSSPKEAAAEGTAATSEAKPVATTSSSTLVTCSEKRYKSGVSVAGLNGFAPRLLRAVKKSEGTGIYPEYKCGELISNRGDAHCQKPNNASLKKELQSALALCLSLEKPAAATEPMVVDCKKKVYKKKAEYAKLMLWSQEHLANLASMTPELAEARCQESYGYAGSAHCLLPAKVEPRKVLKRIALACADDQDRRKAAAEAAIAAKVLLDKERLANRKIVKMPRGLRNPIAKKIKKLILRTSAPSEFHKVVPVSRWAKGVNPFTGIRFRRISAMVLWSSLNDDGICGFSSYIYQQDKVGRRWSDPKLKSNCANCPGGWTKCPKSKKKKSRKK